MTNLEKSILASLKNELARAEVDGTKVILTFDYRHEAVQFGDKLYDYAELKPRK